MALAVRSAPQRRAPATKLEGDRDVFGEGSVGIAPTPGTNVGVAARDAADGRRWIQSSKLRPRSAREWRPARRYFQPASLKMRFKLRSCPLQWKVAGRQRRRRWSSAEKVRLVE